MEREVDNEVVTHKLKTTVLGHLFHVAMKPVFQIRLLRAEKSWLKDGHYRPSVKCPRDMLSICRPGSSGPDRT